uniref:YTH domain-containing protein n=1 Tax=Pyricularia oryzae (strain P131) TaxID=1143193 RepID=L7JIL9_PYRO1
MWPNLFWGFDAYDGSNFNAFPIYFPTEFMQTEPRDQSSCQQLSMEQATEPSMNPDQEDIVEGGENYGELSNQQETVPSFENADQNLSRLEMSTLARELKEKVKQSRALRQSVNNAAEQQPSTKPQPVQQEVQDLINDILKSQDQDDNLKNPSKLTGPQDDTETEKPASTLPTTPRTIKESPLSTYSIPVYCPASPEGRTHIPDEILDNAPKGPRHTHERPSPNPSDKTEETEGATAVRIPPVATDGDLEQDVIMWLRHTGFYDKAKRTDALARWKQLAKMEQGLARPQQDHQEAGVALASASQGSKEAGMGTRPGPDADCPPVCRPEQGGPGSSQAALSCKSKQSTDIQRETLAETRGGSLRDRAANQQPSKKSDRGRCARRHRSSSPRGRSGSHKSRRATTDSPVSRSTTKSTPSRARQPGHRDYREYRDDRNRDTKPRSPLVSCRAAVAFNPGVKGDTRFFIIKSHKENIIRAMKTNIWKTSFDNGRALAHAYRSTKHTILFFSASDSGSFQGYARIVGAPPRDMESNIKERQNHDPERQSGQFGIRWLCTSPLALQNTKSLRNSFDDLKPVLLGRDGQEMDYYCGRDLLRLMDASERGLHRP